MKTSTLAIVLACGMAAPLQAQVGRPASIARQAVRARPLVDSGPVANTGRDPGAAPVFSTVLRQPGAAWVRLVFRDTFLSGNTETQQASYLRITSLADGATQVLNSDQLRQWFDTSAYFNGDAVRIDLFAAPGTGPSRVVVDRVLSEDAGGASPDSLCGADGRLLSNDSRVGRLMPAGCSAFLIGDSGRCLLTAGSCSPGPASVMQFNVPLSGTSGAIAHPSPNHQYPVDPASVQSSTIAMGSDWSYFGVFPNSNTRLGAGASQGSAFTLSPAPANTPYTVRVAGYGAVALPLSLTWNQVQKVATGPVLTLSGSVIGHQADTTAGDAGAPIVLASTGEAVGIHTGDGCVQPGGPEVNDGTALQSAGLQSALNSPQGLCATSAGAVEPPIVIATDAQGHLATMSRTSAGFGSLGPTGVAGDFAGLAYDRGRGRFYGARFNPLGADELYRLDGNSAQATLIGTITGAGDINGLAFDPNTDTLLGIEQSSGQLLAINIDTAQATVLGSPGRTNIGAIDFDPVTSRLYGLQDDPIAGTRLVIFEGLTGQSSIIGTLGAGITDCDGLAYCIEDRSLYTVNQTTGQALRVNPAAGTATVIGAAGSIAGSTYGMASREDCAPPCVPNSPGPFQGQFEISIFTSLYWFGCTNQKIYLVDNGPHVLYDVLTATAQKTQVGSVAPTSNIAGMTWDGGRTLGLDLATGNLFAIDTNTGQPSLVGSTGITGWQGLASDPTEWGWLYGITQNNNLYRISETGGIQIVANSVGSFVGALEFDATGQLWGIEFSSGRILRINKSSGQLTHVATTAAGFQSLDFDDTGMAFGHNSSTSGGGLYTINLQTGVATLRGSTATSAVKAMAFGMPLITIGGDGGGDRPGGEGRGGEGLPQVPSTIYDPTDLFETAPAEIDPLRVIDADNGGLPPGYHAVAGVPVAGRAPEGERGGGGEDAGCGGTLINFDEHYAACSFGVSTRLTTQYEHLGVIFEGPGGNDGAATLNQCSGFNVSGYSGENLLAFNSTATLADGGTPRGPETLRFTSPVSSVQVMVGSGTSTGTVMMTAFRGATVVDTSTVPLGGVLAPLSVLGTGIDRVVITSSAASWAMDDLCFVQSCPTLYDLYFGDTTNPPLVQADSPNNFWRPPEPIESTHLYYWRVVAKNCCGQTEGPLWWFTTQCYPNCDGSTVSPILNVADFSCFLQKFSQGDLYANCDNSTVPPVLNVADFTCFLQRFAQGCPGN